MGPYRRPGRASTFGSSGARTVPSPPIHWIFRLRTRSSAISPAPHPRLARTRRAIPDGQIARPITTPPGCMTAQVTPRASRSPDDHSTTRSAPYNGPTPPALRRSHLRDSAPWARWEPSTSSRTTIWIHGVDANGYWPAAWKPFRMGAPAQTRPPIPRFAVGTGGAAAPNGAVLLGSQDGNIYVIDADEGDVVWKQNVGAMVQASPAGIFPEYGGAKDLLLVGTRNGVPNRFRAYDVDTGAAAWSFENMPIHGGDGSSIGIISGGATVDYGKERVFFASHRTGNSSLWSVDFSTGSAMLEWALDLGRSRRARFTFPARPRGSSWRT